MNTALNDSSRNPQPATRIAPILLTNVLPLGIVLLLALWLRWQYVQEISLYVDEFTTLWAAVQVQAHGAPIMPSGVLYTRGLLASYVEAAFLTLFGFSYTVGRLPSVLFGLATVVAIFVIGKREWRTGVGWLAAIGLALLPEAIIWSARARFYAQLQFFVLLTAWAGYAWIASLQPANSPPGTLWVPRRWLFIILFVLALFSQEETILLYPALLLATSLWSGWHSLLRPHVLVTHLICLAAMGTRFAIEIFGQPGYFETIQTARPYIGLIFDWQGAWHTYSPLLIAPERLPWTLCGLLAVSAALVALVRVDWRLPDLSQFHQATLFFALQFCFVLAVIFIFVGGTWRDTRYLFLVQPFWLLIGAAGAVWLLERLVVAS
jgi:4-amino-4-deoxy-L-arabinose transferase-like glycosyltransferase